MHLTSLLILDFKPLLCKDFYKVLLFVMADISHATNITYLRVDVILLIAVLVVVFLFLSVGDGSLCW